MRILQDFDTEEKHKEAAEETAVAKEAVRTVSSHQSTEHCHVEN